jgi:hypothetical protein
MPLSVELTEGLCHKFVEVTWFTIVVCYAIYGCLHATGVQSAAVNVVCELARKNPKNYLSLAPVFFKLMTTSTNNWMLIKIIKLVSAEICSPILGL